MEDKIERLIEIFNKVKLITVEQLEISPDEIKLDSSFSSDLGADELDIVELVMAIEEEFNIEEIPNEEISTVQSIVAYLNDTDIPGSEIKNILDPNNSWSMKALKIANLIKSLQMDEERLLEIINNQDFISNHKKIRKLITILGTLKTKPSELVEFVEIFSNNFFVGNIDLISKVVSFLDASNISRDEASFLIRDGYVKTYLDNIESLKQSIHQKQIDLQNKLLDLQNKDKEIQTLRSEVKALTSQLDILKKQLESFLLNGHGYATTST